jgi:hypothetical protein
MGLGRCFKATLQTRTPEIGPSVLRATSGLAEQLREGFKKKKKNLIGIFQLEGGGGSARGHFTIGKKNKKNLI